MAIQVKYKLWRDLNNTIGVQCGMCDRTDWNGLLNPILPNTGLVCSNCKNISDQNIRVIAQEQHTQEVEDGLKDTEHCEHEFAYVGSELDAVNRGELPDSDES